MLLRGGSGSRGARAAGCELQLVNLSPRVRELFSATRLLSLVEP
jgi:anti-anti-sigma regulatory factor